MECYKEFAYIYDELINSDIDYKAWGKFIIDICDKYNLLKENYLDLACGTGNLTQAIFKSFKYSFGVDMSFDMLAEAERKMRSNLTKPQFICQDICNLNINKKFDLITCGLDSINYIVDEIQLKKLFLKVKDHLKEESLFIFDINSYFKLKEIIGDNTFTFDSEDVFYVWENTFEDDCANMYLTFFIKQEDEYHRVDEEHKERAYKTEYIMKLLFECGMECVEVFDSYKAQRISEKTERITFVVKII
jgi:SAM-dependent methyltransferase